MRVKKKVTTWGRTFAIHTTDKGSIYKLINRCKNKTDHPIGKQREA